MNGLTLFCVAGPLCNYFGICEIDQDERKQGATERGTFSAYTFLVQNFMMISKIFDKRVSSGVNESYGRGYVRISAIQFLAKTH